MEEWQGEHQRKAEETEKWQNENFRCEIENAIIARKEEWHKEESTHGAQKWKPFLHLWKHERFSIKHGKNLFQILLDNKKIEVKHLMKVELNFQKKLKQTGPILKIEKD